MPEISTHPTAQALALFGHGKLPQDQAATVAAHLETCADCRKAVAGLPPDSFLGKVQAAGLGGTSASTKPPSGVAKNSYATLPGADSPPPVPDLPPALANHPKFRILRELGRGGMGVIYLAEHRVLDKPVALKVINPAVLDNPDAVARFLSEVKAAGKLDHPNIARAHDADRAGELHFLVMEYVEGMSLAQLLQKKGPLSIASASHCVCQAALGLQHAFEQGMAHRDVKPQNLMLAPKGVVKVLDFGLARLRGPRAVGKGLTQADAFMGTPEYVAPEQAADARSADIRADIYSLGCTLYALLTGRPPFQEDTMVKLVLAHIEKEPAPLHEVRPDVPAEVSAVAAKMLAKDPAQRYQQPIEVARALAPFAKGGARARAAGAAPPAEKSATTGTVMSGDTSRAVEPGEKAPKPPANKPAVPEPSPFGGTDWTRHPPAPLPPRKPEKKRTAPAPAPWWKRPAVLAGGGAGLVLLLLAVLLAAGVVRLKTKDGTIVLEDLPPDAEVLVDGDRATVTWGADAKKAEVRVKPGGHQVEVRKEGMKVQGEQVEIEDGGRKVLTVRLEPRPADAPPGKPDRPRADYDALATGRWVNLLPSQEEFERLRSQKSYMRDEPRFDHGIMETKNGGRMIFPEVDATNLILRARVRRLGPKGGGGLRNQGLSLRQARGQPVHYDAWYNGGGEFGIQKWDSSQSTRAKVLATCQLADNYDGFFEFAFAAVGDELTLYADGKRILRVHGPEVVPHPGRVFVGGEGLFRDIEIQVLDPAAKPAAGEETGFRPLFNGKDLTGWKTHDKQPGNWYVTKEGILMSSGPISHLYTERGDYKDFHLRVEARINDGGNSGLIFRTSFGPRIPADNPKFLSGYEAQINSTHGDPNKTGSLYAGGDGVLVSLRESPVPAGQWFTEEVIAQGNHIVVKVNGKTTADYTDEKRGYTTGHIALQQHDARTVAEFRKVEIKELK